MPKVADLDVDMHVDPEVEGESWNTPSSGS